MSYETNVDIRFNTSEMHTSHICNNCLYSKKPQTDAVVVLERFHPSGNLNENCFSDKKSTD